MRKTYPGWPLRSPGSGPDPQPEPRASHHDVELSTEWHELHRQWQFGPELIATRHRQVETFGHGKAQTVTEGEAGVDGVTAVGARYSTSTKLGAGITATSDSVPMVSAPRSLSTQASSVEASRTTRRATLTGRVPEAKPRCSLTDTSPPDTYGLPRREKEPVPDNRHLVWGDRLAVDDKVVSGVKTPDPRPLRNDLLGDGGRES